MCVSSRTGVDPIRWRNVAVGANGFVLVVL
jgi:hypothetical protein